MLASVLCIYVYSAGLCSVFPDHSLTLSPCLPVVTLVYIISHFSNIISLTSMTVTRLVPEIPRHRESLRVGKLSFYLMGNYRMVFFK